MKSETAVEIIGFSENKSERRKDVVAVEEPLAVFLDGAPLYTTMRSPGQEKELALGYCYAEGIINSLADVDLIRYCGEEAGNSVDVVLSPQGRAAKAHTTGAPTERRLPAYTACGLCGKEMIMEINAALSVRATGFALSGAQIQDAIDAIDAHQQVFARTGGTHAVGFFDEKGELFAFAEDIGRHNAVDKALGKTLLAENTGNVMALGLTSRLSYEMVLKAIRTPAQILIGMSAPTSLALALAQRVNLTVVGFARRNRFNVYCGAERIKG